MPIFTRALLIVGAGPCLIYGVLNSYQAVTGRRLSKRPSRRTDQEMRRQSAVAAIVCGGFGLLALMLVISG